MATDMNLIILIWMQCIMLHFVNCQNAPTLEQGPSNTTAYVGDSVTLICDLDDQNTLPVAWFSAQTHSFITRNGILRNPILRDRFSVQMNWTRQTYSLCIADVQLGDAGMYGCWYQRDYNVIPLSSAYLNVLVPPTRRPTCDVTYLPQMETGSADQEMDVSCTWDTNHTGAITTMYQDDVELTPDIILDDRLIKRVSLGLNDSNVTFMCKIALPEINWSTSCTIRTIPDPEIKLGINPLVVKTQPHTKVSLACYGQSATAINSYKWILPSNVSYHTEKTYNTTKNYSSIEITRLASGDDMLVVQCQILTDSGATATSVAVVSVRHKYSAKSSKVIVGSIAGLMILLLVCVVVMCRMCSRKKISDSFSRQKLLAVKSGKVPNAYDTVAKYYNDGHVSLNLDDLASNPSARASLIEASNGGGASSADTHTTKPGSLRAALYSKPDKLPKKQRRSNKSAATRKKVERNMSRSNSGSDSEVLYENLPRTGSVTSLYSRRSSSSSSFPRVFGADINGVHNIYEEDPIKHSYIGFTEDNHNNTHSDDDDEHDYHSIDDAVPTGDKKTLLYADLDLPKKTSHPKPKPRVKWADKGVTYTELQI